MKIITYITILAITLGFACITTSCKKGENDLFLSLKTRNSRLKGLWVLEKSVEITERNREGMDLGEPYTYQFKSNRTIENGVENSTSIGTYIAEGSEPFENDCTFVRNRYIERNFQKNGIFTQFSVIDEDSVTSYIEWYWLNQEKKKTGLVINGVLFQVDRLANDELVLKRDEYETSEYDDGSGFYSSTSDYTYSYTATFKKE